MDKEPPEKAHPAGLEEEDDRRQPPKNPESNACKMNPMILVCVQQLTEPFSCGAHVVEKT